MSYVQIPVDVPTYFALGVPAGIQFPDNPADEPLGCMIYQQQLKMLDLLHYGVWSDAVTGAIDRQRMTDDSHYWPPSAARLLSAGGCRITQTTLTQVVDELHAAHLLWSWDAHVNPLTFWDTLLLYPLGMPIGDPSTRGLYGVGLNATGPILRLDEISYRLWLEWYVTPILKESVYVIAEDIQGTLQDVLAHATATMVNALRSNLLYIDAVAHQ